MADFNLPADIDPTPADAQDLRRHAGLQRREDPGAHLARPPPGVGGRRRGGRRRQPRPHGGGGPRPGAPRPGAPAATAATAATRRPATARRSPAAPTSWSMVHPDHQYDPRAIPALVAPLLRGECDAVFGSRMLGGRPAGRRDAEVEVPGEHLPHRARQRHVLRLPLRVSLRAARLQPALSRDGAPGEQLGRLRLRHRDHRPGGLRKGLHIQEIPIQTRYFPEASQIGFWRSVRYGLSVLGVLLALQDCRRKGLLASRIFAARRGEYAVQHIPIPGRGRRWQGPGGAPAAAGLGRPPRHPLAVAQRGRQAGRSPPPRSRGSTSRPPPWRRTRSAIAP